MTRTYYDTSTISGTLSIGVGVNWNSPFGPLHIDVAKALLKALGDDSKTVTFNIGGQFVFTVWPTVLSAQAGMAVAVSRMRKGPSPASGIWR